MVSTVKVVIPIEGNANVASIVDQDITTLDDADVALKAPLASPTFTGRVKLPNQQIAETAYSTDGAIAKGVGIAVLTKGTAGAYTLAAPTDVTDDGLILIIMSYSAAAHVVTATGLLEDGVTGGAKNAGTFAAFKGATITLCAHNAKWIVMSKNIVTVA